MTSPTQPKPTPVPAILVYGTPTSPELTQASWFRAEDKQAAKNAAEALKFSVIEIQTEAERALTLGVHEGVLKGSGRMIVGSVSSEVYRCIEKYVAKVAGDETSHKPANIDPAAPRPTSEQNMNQTAVPPAAATSDDTARMAVSSAPIESKPPSAAPPVAATLNKPANPDVAPANPWDTLRVGARV
jgi:hypothetical protein